MISIEQAENTRLHFILSTGRSGSTLLTAMLNMNRHVISTTEEPFAYNLFLRYKNIKKWTPLVVQQFCYDFYLFSEGLLGFQFGTYDELLTVLLKNRGQLTVYKAINLAFLCFIPNKDKTDIRAIADKELKFHMVIEEIAAFYPAAKFIVLIRDPRDNALIKWRRAAKKKHKGNYYRYGFIWQHVYGTIERKAKNIGEDRFMWVRYEDLVTDPETTLSKICSFIQVPYSAGMLEYDTYVKERIEKKGNELAENVKHHLKLFHEGLTQKVNTSKIDIWKKEIPPYQANILWTLCGNLAEKKGYKRDDNFTPIKKRALFLRYIYHVLKFVWYPKVYYAMPFWLKRFSKKIKRGKVLKKNDFAAKDFYRFTLPE